MIQFNAGNALDIIPGLPMVDMVLADLPYSTFPLINQMIKASRQKCHGASLFFMYAEDLCLLDEQPDQVLFWVKPVSTKNTKKRYSRFVEVIAVYDSTAAQFNQNLHWSNRTGIFTDQLMEVQFHPFQKPVSLIQRLILNHTQPGNTILDPCTGSGTTLWAADELGRSAIGIEISSEYITYINTVLEGKNT